MSETIEMVKNAKIEGEKMQLTAEEIEVMKATRTTAMIKQMRDENLMLRQRNSQLSKLLGDTQIQLGNAEERLLAIDAAKVEDDNKLIQEQINKSNKQISDRLGIAEGERWSCNLETGTVEIVQPNDAG